MRRSGEIAVAVAAVATVVLWLLSWVVATLAPSLPLRTPLSGEGLRWYFGHITRLLAAPPLVWLVLGVMAWGAVERARVWRGGIQREALRASLLTLAAMVGVMLLLALPAEAPLRSAVGTLIPGTLTHCAVPVALVTIAAMGIAYGMASGRYTSPRDIVRALTSAFQGSGILFMLYIVWGQLLWTVRFCVE